MRHAGKNKGERSARDRGRGFSLVELLIVVAIILIIAAIAIPNLIRSRMAANETSAVGSLRVISTAEVSYNSHYQIGFGTTLGVLGGAAGVAVANCANALLLDPVLSGNGGAQVPTQKSGYNFNLVPTGVPYAGVVPAGCPGPGDAAGYAATAWPINVGMTGQNSFCTDTSGVIRRDPTGAPPAPAAGLCPGAMLPVPQ